ncbi:hypothetical protein [Tautonia plasticadhaerens]|uniref:Uncharacterized protein n=1 Tax=Tautonia plasticadhaerens TaxID=2527974 RepID=A0A518GZ42_9BACT|nr:hypothetical protein [Tautonia plasticadhaerens]QDV33841.1 hypothetical protein ElP_17210 [Tautonia plasticadhaerens]
MTVPRPIPRQALTIAALIGLVAAVLPGPRAVAGTCHEADRPVFGLSTGGAGEPVPAPADRVGTVAEPSPVRIEPSCPSEDPDRGPTRLVVGGELPLSDAIRTAARTPSRGFLRADRDRSRPLQGPNRIDRPPRAR